MKTKATILAATFLVAALGAAAPARAADICIQFSGVSCDLSGDLGYFRFIGGKFPMNNKKVTKLNGRACGYGSVTGSLVRNIDNGSVHLGATFVCDATPGVITAEFNPASTAIGATSTSAYAGYGTFTLNTSCTATIVDCTINPL